MNDAAQRALSMVGRGYYWLGGGDYAPAHFFPSAPPIDEPWTRGPENTLVAGKDVCDCSAFAMWAHRLRKHRPGFNHGAWATVSDDINTDSITEDAMHKRELFSLVTMPEPGDLIVYRSIWQDALGAINDEGRGTRRWIGHIGVIVDVPAGWGAGELASLGVVHCHGPQGKGPAVTRSDGSIWAHHGAMWNDDGAHPMRSAMLVRVIVA